MNDEKKLSLLQVKVKDLEEHLTNRKAKDLLLEAMDCIEKWGNWKCWFCYEDSKKFGDRESFMLHLYDMHDLRIQDDILSVCLLAIVDEPAAGFEDERGCADSGVVVGLTGCRWVNEFKTNDMMSCRLTGFDVQIRLSSARIWLDSSRSVSVAAEFKDGRGCANSGMVVGLSPVG
ncbi:hypothetical protein WN943_004381 [Citrus x changshan-huyou]